VTWACAFGPSPAAAGARGLVSFALGVIAGPPAPGHSFSVPPASCWPTSAAAGQLARSVHAADRRQFMVALELAAVIGFIGLFIPPCSPKCRSWSTRCGCGPGQIRCWPPLSPNNATSDPGAHQAGAEQISVSVRTMRWATRRACCTSRF
jgi:hypothetical protein